ncbi:hypothetical protein NEAUS04_2133 [Nematocida ausubeli]|uniref:Uncharacterized protein n=1 Tax=Nematocida ausubeli (strain ATCC PRA-371 / ERTm2) TaxID=1913371 RepID=A0A086J1D8_NEMA1|nr:uncharacterized protein NESG_01945 [Nematocida ausubeli]KAI5132737.1 hypothetical protein NEAUS06_0333 [Nematocida ausubeli]KAI5146652.1 hypothetical protein NEAUS05_0097 [Nematocida ausubeli]KAI5164339.1 hypothetical protein NEAUS04_2133 [Nematocida ausubeli]KFG25956.1 hypothetical protein NESG_01945 [Nematocida ausubeli]
MNFNYIFSFIYGLMLTSLELFQPLQGVHPDAVSTHTNLSGNSQIFGINEDTRYFSRKLLDNPAITPEITGDNLIKTRIARSTARKHHNPHKSQFKYGTAYNMTLSHVKPIKKTFHKAPIIFQEWLSLTHSTNACEKYISKPDITRDNPFIVLEGEINQQNTPGTMNIWKKYTSDNISIDIPENTQYPYKGNHVLVNSYFSGLGLVKIPLDGMEYIISKSKDPSTHILTVMDKESTKNTFPMITSFVISGNSVSAPDYMVSSDKNNPYIIVDTSKTQIYTGLWGCCNKVHMTAVDPVYVHTKAENPNLHHINTTLIESTNNYFNSKQGQEEPNILVQSTFELDLNKTVIIEEIKNNGKTAIIHFVEIFPSKDRVMIGRIDSYTPATKGILKKHEKSPINRRHRVRKGHSTVTIYQTLINRMKMTGPENEDLINNIRIYINTIYTNYKPSDSGFYPEINNLQAVNLKGFRRITKRNSFKAFTYEFLHSIKEYSFLLDIYNNMNNNNNPFRKNQLNSKTHDREHLKVLQGILSSSKGLKPIKKISSNKIPGKQRFPEIIHDTEFFTQYCDGLSEIEGYDTIGFKNASLPMHADKMFFYLSDGSTLNNHKLIEDWYKVMTYDVYPDNNDLYSDSHTTDVLGTKNNETKSKPVITRSKPESDYRKNNQKYTNLLSVHASYKLSSIVNKMRTLENLDLAHTLIKSHKIGSKIFSKLMKPYIVNVLSFYQMSMNLKYDSFRQFVTPITETLQEYDFNELTVLLTDKLKDFSLYQARPDLSAPKPQNTQKKIAKTRDNPKGKSAAIILHKMVTIIHKTIGVMDLFSSHYLKYLSAVANQVIDPNYNIEMQKLENMKASLRNDNLITYLLVANNMDINHNLKIVLTETLIPMQTNLLILANNALNIISKNIYAQLHRRSPADQEDLLVFMEISKNILLKEWMHQVSEYSNSIKIFNHLQASIIQGDNNPSETGNILTDNLLDKYMNIRASAVTSPKLYDWEPVPTIVISEDNLSSNINKRDLFMTELKANSTRIYNSPISEFLLESIKKTVQSEECAEYKAEIQSDLIKQYEEQISNAPDTAGKIIKRVTRNNPYISQGSRVLTSHMYNVGEMRHVYIFKDSPHDEKPAASESTTTKPIQTNYNSVPDKTKYNSKTISSDSLPKANPNSNSPQPNYNSNPSKTNSNSNPTMTKSNSNPSQPNYKSNPSKTNYNSNPTMNNPTSSPSAAVLNVLPVIPQSNLTHSEISGVIDELVDSSIMERLSESILTDIMSSSNITLPMLFHVPAYANGKYRMYSENNRVIPTILHSMITFSGKVQNYKVSQDDTNIFTNATYYNEAKKYAINLFSDVTNRIQAAATYIGPEDKQFNLNRYKIAKVLEHLYTIYEKEIHGIFDGIPKESIPRCSMVLPPGMCIKILQKNIAIINNIKGHINNISKYHSELNTPAILAEKLHSSIIPVHVTKFLEFFGEKNPSKMDANSDLLQSLLLVYNNPDNQNIIKFFESTDYNISKGQEKIEAFLMFFYHLHGKTLAELHAKMMEKSLCVEDKLSYNYGKNNEEFINLDNIKNHAELISKNVNELSANIRRKIESDRSVND